MSTLPPLRVRAGLTAPLCFAGKGIYAAGNVSVYFMSNLLWMYALLPQDVEYEIIDPVPQRPSRRKPQGWGHALPLTLEVARPTFGRAVRYE